MTNLQLHTIPGYLFEVGFNIGMLTYIEQNQLKHHFGDLYRQDLEHLNLHKMVHKVANDQNIIDYQARKTFEKWCLFFLQKSYLSGLNFLREYLTAIGWDKRPHHLDILYYQCCFYKDNSLGTYEKEESSAYHAMLSQLGDQAQGIDTKKYSNKGEFLRADTLILIRRNQQLRLLSIDYSIFAINFLQDLVDLDNIEHLRRILHKEIRYLKSKSVFSCLGLDSQDFYQDFETSLSRYYKAFTTKDKETAKMIQAGSYAYSFSQWLQEVGMMTEDLSLTYHIIGYSDRGISAMTLNQNNAKLLNTCNQIYIQQPKEQEIEEARQNVFQYIKRNAARSFDHGRDFIEQLLNVSPNTTHLITHQECLTEFQNIAGKLPPALAQDLNLDPQLTLRDAHAKLIEDFLSPTSPEVYLFLTGNPGIGKTTAIAQCLKTDTYTKEGFLLFYVSPRTQVNLDIINKFKQEDNPERLYDDSLFTMTTNATFIEQNKGSYTINYLSNQRQDQFIAKTIHFIHQNTEIENQSFYSGLKRQTEDTLNYAGYQGKGVLETICQGIYTVINQNLSRNIIATVAIQSLKKTNKGKDTLIHLRKIFKDVYNSRRGKPIPEKMKQFSGRIKNLIFMIDEITGDEGGVEFLEGIGQILRDYDLTNPAYGFNIKIIVADASIIDQKVIQQHLNQTDAEPNKIFFRKGKINPTSLSLQHFKFKNHPSVIINANSYPASTLTLTYKILVQSAQLHNKDILKEKLDLEKRVQTNILKDILHLMSQTTISQIIVYIQNKQRLYELIQKIQDKLERFEKYDDYLEIHASLGEQEKKEIHQRKNKVKVIFMTASASRGLSFPKVKYILVDIPHFEIEQNLMEIIQVIYRGRGYYGQGKTFDQDDKELIFYLSEKIIHYEEDTSLQQQITLQQGILNILNILIILKTSIMTRITGQGKIGTESVMMIPIGGKSVYTAGQTFSSVMSNLIKQLKQEFLKYPHKKNIKDVAALLENLLQSASFVVTNLSDNSDTSYLQLIESFNREFVESVNQSFAKLLNFSAIQQSYISGSLLIIPLDHQSVEETYRLQFQQILSSPEGHKMINKLCQIQRDEQTPNSLRLATKDAIKLINLLQEKPDKTQQFEQKSQYDDQYYLLPLFIFACEQSLKSHFKHKNTEPEDMSFRDILKAYIRLIYPVMNILPIGHHYQEFPFLLFRSYSLKELRTKLFTERYFLTSHQLNILNLMLFKD